MVVISISLTESSDQIVAGFPTTVALSANVPATIFYTIDGTEPTTASEVYVSAITLPTDVLEFVLKVFATNGVDSSAIVTTTYSTDILHNARLPHSILSDDSNNAPYSQYPFGSNSPSPTVTYLNPGSAGVTVDDPTLPEITYGYDANGDPVAANEKFDDYLNIYSTTDYLNKTTSNVGNLPGKVTIVGRRSALEYTPEESTRQSPLFNSKAMVIFQDITTEDPSNPPQINPQSFSLENLEVSKDGSALYASGLESPTITGSFLRSYYNPRTQMITSYYRDSSTNRWIISSAPYEPKQTDPGNLSGMVFGRNNGGVGKVFSWNLFRYSVLT
jgi:hypothetical protein